MKLNVGIAADLYSGLVSLDALDLKLSAEVRLKLAVNMDKLKPIVRKFEVRNNKILADLQAKARQANAGSDRPVVTEAQIMADFADRIEAVKDEEVELKLWRIELKSLALETNTRLRPQVLANLMPILSGVERDELDGCEPEPGAQPVLPS